MSEGELKLPVKPPNARTFSNMEMLRQLSHDLTILGSEELVSAIHGYRIYRHAGLEKPSWGYCLEYARVEETDENLILFRKDIEGDEEKSLSWVPISSFYTVEQIKLYKVSYSGPSENVLQLLLELFRDVFEFAMKTNWSYEKRMEFYYSIPFEGLSTRRAMKAFRQAYFSCPTFDGFEWTFPELEE